MHGGAAGLAWPAMSIGARFVCATAGGNRVAFSIDSVQEVLAPRAITRLFHAPPSLLGVVNLRGEILPVVDLSQLLGEPSSPPTLGVEARLIVVRVPIGSGAQARFAPLALLVANLDALRDGTIDALPAGVPDVAARFARGIVATPSPAVLVIDVEKLAAVEELATLRA